jgi:CBS domain containing-hemolysin-like protein
MDVWLTLTRPIIFVMSRAAGTVLRLFGLRKMRQGPVHSPDEVKLIVSASREVGQLAPFQEDLVHHALDLEDISAREVMVPRPDIFSLPGNLSVTEALDKVVEEQHSRVPVYDPASGPEHIIGILYAKDVMRWARLRLSANNPQGSTGRLTDMKISQLMHDALVVPETKPLAELLEEFKDRKRHMAIVVDEFGSTAGIITVEDILEQLVGEIEDEYDIAPVGSQFPAEGKTMVLDGTVSLRDLESQYELELPRDSGFETGRVHALAAAEDPCCRRLLHLRWPPVHG